MTRETTPTASARTAPPPCASARNADIAITCQLDTRGHRCYEVCVVPHRQPSWAVIERFDVHAKALLRQAEIVRCLRSDGWMVIDRIAADGSHAAA